MVPSTYFSVLSFVIFVAPGFFFDSLSRRRKVGVDESAFQQVSRLVLSSMAFSVMAIMLVALLRVARASWVVDLTAFLTNGNEYLVKHYALIFWDLLAELLLACVLAAGSNLILAKFGGIRVRPDSSWKRYLNDKKPNGSVAIAWVRFTDGTVYEGRVADFTHDLSVEDREIVLMKPLRFQASGGDLVSLHESWSRVLITGAQVTNIAVKYNALPPEEAEGTRVGRPFMRRVMATRVPPF